METKTTVVAKINETEIMVIQNGEDRVPIRPICEALGITVQGQLERLKNDPILGSVIKPSFTTGADGKEYEMQTIPFKFVFGWLFRIDARNVKDESKEAVIKYQVACYDALYEFFIGAKKFLEVKEKETERLITSLKQANKNYFTAKTLKRDAESALEKLSKVTYQEYLSNNCQLTIQFEE